MPSAGGVHLIIYGHKRTFPFTMVGRDGARSEKPRRSRASLPDHPSRVMRIGGACCARGTASGAIPLAVWRPGGAWGGFASLRSLPTGPARRASGAFAVAGYRRRPRPTDDAGRGAWRRHGGGPTRGDAVTDLPLIKAAKLWAKVSQRTGATYLTGRWGGCRVLVFENLERTSEAEPSHFLFLGEAGEWPVPDKAHAPATVPGPAQAVPELQAVPAAPVEDGVGKKPVRRRRKAPGGKEAGPPRKAR